MSLPRVCFLGLDDLPVLSPAFNYLGAAGEPVQHTLLARALVRRGFPVSMIVADHGQPDGMVVDGVTTYRAYRREAGVPVLRFVFPRWVGVMSALQRANPDVLYTSCAGIGVGQVAWFARQRNLRTVFRAASDTDCDPQKLLVNAWWDRLIYEYGLRRADSVLVQTQHQQQMMNANYGLVSRIAGMLVEHGNADIPFAARDIAALWVSNLRHLKRPDLFLDLAQSAPEMACNMVGGSMAGESQIFTETESRASGIPNLTFSGSVPYHDINPMFQRTRVFVNTSDVEGFPNTYLQAWAHGTPVVAFFDPDGVIARERLGFVAQDLDEMRDATRRLSSDQAEWTDASARCRRFMAAHFSEDQILSEYVRALVPAAQSA